MTCFVGYHGSTSRVERFSTQRRQRSEYGDGFYFTDDFATAEHYGPVVGRYEICFCRPLHAHQLTLGDLLAERSGQALPSRLRDQGAWITHTAQALGYDGLVLTLASGQRYFVAFSPSQVRLVKEGPPVARLRTLEDRSVPMRQETLRGLLSSADIQDGFGSDGAAVCDELVRCGVLIQVRHGARGRHDAECSEFDLPDLYVPGIRGLKRSLNPQ